MSQIPVYPSLSSYAGALTDPKEVIPSILRGMFATPAYMSDYFEGKLNGAEFNYKLSFRRIEAMYGGTPTAAANQLAHELARTFARYFPERRINTDVYCRGIDDNTGEEVEMDESTAKFQRYVIYIDVQERMADGTMEPIILSNKVTVDHVKHKFIIHFEGEDVEQELA